MAFGAKIKLSVDTSNASKFRSEIQNAVNNAIGTKPIVLRNFSVKMTKEQRSRLVNEIQTYLNQISDNESFVLKIGHINAKSAVNELKQQLQTMLSGLKITGLKEFLGESNIDKIVEDIDKAKQGANQWAAQMATVNDIAQQLKRTYKSSLSGNKEISDISEIQKITEEYTKWMQQVEQMRSTKAALSAEDLQNLQNEGIRIQRNITLIQEKQSAEKLADSEAKKSEKEKETAANKELLLSQRQVSLMAQVQRYIMSNSKAYAVYGDQLDGILQTLQGLHGNDLSDEKLKAIKKSFTEVQMMAKTTGDVGSTFFDTMKKGWEKFGGWSLVTKSMTKVFVMFKDMVEAVKEVDAAMTELKKVTDLTTVAYERFLSTASTMATTVGASLADTINATADFARLGYNIEESASLAEAALIYKNVGDGIENISDASESLISTIKAFEQFGESAENAMNIVDKFNKVGNEFPISSEGIGEALKRSASALATAGNDLNSSIALITAANSVVQDPDSVGKMYAQQYSNVLQEDSYIGQNPEMDKTEVIIK